MSDSKRPAGAKSPHGKMVHRAAFAEEVVILTTAESRLSAAPPDIPQAELEQSYRRLVLLYDLGGQICGETDEKRVFHTVLSAVGSLLNGERAFIATVSQGRLVPRGMYQIELSEDMSQWPVSTTMLQRVLEERISLLTTDALHDARYGHAPSVDLHNIRSVMCCPLGDSREPLGLIYVDNRICTGAFCRSDLEFLNALCYYATLAIKNARERHRIGAEKELAEARLEALRNEMTTTHNIVGVSRRMVEVYDQARRAARKDVPILLVGETGTGKEILARFIHASSPRSKGPFVAVNVNALSRTLVESELFGHEKGSFTGANQKRIGRFELAQGGVLLLDELQDIPLEVQVKLLRVLEQRSFERVGGNEPIQADVRIVGASNKDLAACVAEGTFREDLFYRLNSVMFELPPLQERREDILPLVSYFLKECGSEKVFAEDALDCMMSYAWPGNVRELKNCIEALDALVDEKCVRSSHLPARMQKPAGLLDRQGEFEPLMDLVGRVEREHILKALHLADGNNEAAIRLLGISRAKFFARKKLYES